MTVDAEITSATSTSTLTAAADYLGLTPEQRYAVISEKFPAWLLAEPIVFPRHDRTYGWACRVPGCEAAPTDMQLQFMSWGHTHQYREVREPLSVQEFFGQAKPFRSMLGRGSEGGPAAESVETTARRADWATADTTLRILTTYDVGEASTRKTGDKPNRHSRRFRPARFRGVFTMASNYATDVFNSRPMCQIHYEQWLKWLEISGRDRDEAAWTAW